MRSANTAEQGRDKRSQRASDRRLHAAMTYACARTMGRGGTCPCAPPTPPPLDPLLLPAVSGSQKRQQAEACHKPEEAEAVSGTQTFEDGRVPPVERPIKTGQLDGQCRSQGCILYDPNGSRRPSIPQIRVAKQDLLVELSPIWVVRSSVGLYQDHMASCGSPAGERTAPDNLHRRYSHHGRDRVSPEGPCDSSGIPAGKSGVCYQSPQIRVYPHTGNGIPGVHSQFLNGAEAARRDDQKDQNQGRQNSATTLSIASSPLLTDWEDQCGHSGYTNGSNVLQRPLGMPQRGFERGPGLLLYENQLKPEKSWNGGETISPIGMGGD